MGLQLADPTFGGDPEAFLARNGAVIGSERVVPDEGIPVEGGGKIVQDGVQIEFNFPPHKSVGMVGAEVAKSFLALREKIKSFEGVEVSFDQLVKVDKKEFDSLSLKSKEFGCKPTYNIYGLPGPVVDPHIYLGRTAAGHIQMGLSAPVFDPKSGVPDGDEIVYTVDNRKRVVPMLDLFVGNTGVLLELDPKAAKERRRNYGKAGEFRLPEWGLEYRALPNIWLKAYPLMELFFGLSRLAVSVIHHTILTGENLEGELCEHVKWPKVTEAIQNSNMKTAMRNFDVVKGFIETRCQGLGDEIGLNPGLLDKFELFLKNLHEKGLKHYFPDDPMDHWVELGMGREFPSWGTFLRESVV